VEGFVYSKPASKRVEENPVKAISKAQAEACGYRIFSP